MRKKRDRGKTIQRSNSGQCTLQHLCIRRVRNCLNWSRTGQWHEGFSSTGKYAHRWGAGGDKQSNRWDQATPSLAVYHGVWYGSKM